MEDLKQLKGKAVKSSGRAYFVCLFLVMANKRCKPVKEFMHETFLVDKQHHPGDVLAMN